MIKRGIKVNEYLQTSNAAVFACGDVLSKTQPKLTPVSTFEGNYLVHYLTGETAAQAGKQEDDYEVSSIDATSWFTIELTSPFPK